MPQADVVNLEGIGHWPKIKAPQACFEAILCFVPARRD